MKKPVAANTIRLFTLKQAEGVRDLLELIYMSYGPTDGRDVYLCHRVRDMEKQRPYGTDIPREAFVLLRKLFTDSLFVGNAANTLDVWLTSNTGMTKEHLAHNPILRYTERINWMNQLMKALTQHITEKED